MITDITTNIQILQEVEKCAHIIAEYRRTNDLSVARCLYALIERTAPADVVDAWAIGSAFFRLIYGYNVDAHQRDTMTFYGLTFKLIDSRIAVYLDTADGFAWQLIKK